MKIAVDLDGVCYDWGGTVRLLLEEYRGLEVGESTHWSYIPDTIPPADWEWLWEDGIKLGMFRHGHVIKGAIESLRQLSREHEIIIVTHRHWKGIHDTMAWLTLHLRDVPLAGVHLLTREEPKSTVTYDVLIDDKPENVDDAEAAGRWGIIFDQPWNKGYAAGSRARGWQDVRKLIEVHNNGGCYEDANETLDAATASGNSLRSFLRTAAGNADARRESGPDWPSFDYGSDCD